MHPPPVQASTFYNGVTANAILRLCVVSDDQDLISLCREVLRELRDTSSARQVEYRCGPVPNCEVCLWDYEPERPGPSFEGPDFPKVFYLVHPTHLESLRQRVPSSEGNVLLKPVTRAVLGIFLASNMPDNGAAGLSRPTSSELGSLRASRDDILQSLLHSNLRLQEYDQQRTNFIARAVHDFRAPLTALSGFCGLLAGGELGPLNDQQREALQRMQHSTKRIARMATAMFDLSIGLRTNSKPNLQEGDIQERIKQALHEVLPLAREKEISLRAEDIVPPPTPLYFEPSQIEQVLVNLLDNACKFTPRRGSIEVRAYPYFWERRFLAKGSVSVNRRIGTHKNPNAYRVDVADSGPGVPPDLQSNIFEEYTSYSGPQDRSGGGLGLAICKHVMSGHQGRVWVESNQNGAVFSFVLPYRPQFPDNVLLHPRS
ncbi:MAG: HAMP domain-containing histidine kinase [Acidobacteriia bacterium]|nr:HAMP domain-containing histidine kinase [Terriglobia bacterium]